MPSSNGLILRQGGVADVPPRCPSSQTTKTQTKMAKGSRPSDYTHRRTPLRDCNFFCDNSATRRCQSRSFSGWAVLEAPNAITTMKCQAHEAKLQALDNSQPVSNTSPSFLRETSPARSDVTTELLNLKTSSLVQMWREFEAEARPDSRRISRSSSIRSAVSTQTNATNTDNGSFMEEPSVHYSTDERLMDWESDLITPSEPPSSSRVSLEMGENERGRVADMIRRYSGCSTCSHDEIDLREQSPEHPHSPISLQNSSLFYGRKETFEIQCSGNPNSYLMLGKQDMRHLLMQFGIERKMELASLRERHSVSQFLHHLRIQSLLQWRFLSQQVAVQDSVNPAASSVELDQVQRGGSIFLPRERFKCQGQKDASALISGSPQMRFPTNSVSNSLDSGSSGLLWQIMRENREYQQDTTRAREAEALSPTNEELQEVMSQNSDGGWSERSVSIDNLDWQENVNHSANLETWDIWRDVRSAEETWVTNSSNRVEEWSVGRQSVYDEWLENNSDNVELRELLERRSVSTTLASDFRERMEQMIMSFLKSQGHEPIDYEVTEEDEEQSSESRYSKVNDAEMVASTSTQMPIASHYLHYQDNAQQQPSFADHIPHHSPEEELIYDLRDDMTRLHQDMHDLRKSIQSCMNMQADLQCSMKEEVSTVVDHSAAGETLPCSNCLPRMRRNGNCRLCGEMQVDSLLYRCGHMCTCFKCAQELQWTSGRCPICQAPIVDVVRAYSDPLRRW